MSTSAATPGVGPRSFRRTMLVVLGVLALLAGALAVGNIVQGPRVASADINTVGAVEQSGTRLVITPNQTVQAIELAQITVEPAAPYSFAQENGALVFTFEELLRYDTTYAVSIAGVTSATTRAASTLEAEFSTPELQVSTLVRGAVSSSGASEDRVVEVNVSGGGEPRILYAAPRVQEYALTDAFVAVIEQEASGNGLIGVAPRAEPGPVVPLNLHATGKLSKLAADAESGLIGFVVDGMHDDGQRAYDRSLFVFDTSDASFRPKEITGPAGEPLQVSNWAFAPRTGSLVAQTLDEQLYLVNVLAGTPAQAIGQARNLHGFLPGTSIAVSSGVNGYTLLDLAQGTTTPLTLAPVATTETEYLTQTAVLDAPGTHVSAVADAAASLAEFRVVHSPAGGEPRVLTESGGGGEWLRAICVSPNGQYVAVETGQGSLGPDGYAVLPGMLESTTTIVEIASGAELRRLSGFLPSWCR